MIYKVLFLPNLEVQKEKMSIIEMLDKNRIRVLMTLLQDGEALISNALKNWWSNLWYKFAQIVPYPIATFLGSVEPQS